MKYATIKRRDVANGPGVRVSLFVSGCTHHCKGCFNEEAWDFNYGNVFDDKVIKEICDDMEPDYIQGLSLLGGEPFEIVNQKGILPLILEVRKKYPHKDIWCYSGYLFDKDMLKGKFKNNKVTQKILRNIDVLVDGKFVEDLKDPTIQFRGSTNQRIIDVKKSLECGKIILWEDLIK